MKKFKRARIAFFERLLEIPAKAHVTTENHEGVDIAPNFISIGNGAGFAVQISDGRNWNVSADSRRAFFSSGTKRKRRGFFHGDGSGMCVVAQNCLALRGVAQMIHQAQAGHGVLRVADGGAVLRSNFQAREFFR